MGNLRNCQGGEKTKERQEWQRLLGKLGLGRRAVRRNCPGPDLPDRDVDEGGKGLF